MDFRSISVMSGPNIWARVPMVTVELDLTGLDAKAVPAPAEFHKRLHAWLPSLAIDHSHNGAGGPALLSAQLGASLASALERTTVALQSLAGSAVEPIGLVVPMESAGCYRLLIACEEPALTRACLDAARKLCLAALHDRPYDLPAELGKLRELAYGVRLGPSTGAIVRAARQRNIPVYRLNDASLVQLGQGAGQRRILTAETDRTSAIAEAIAQDKQLTRALLQAVGVPVPEGRPVDDAADAWLAAEDLGPPVVVKPQYGNHGRGVATDLRTQKQVARAYAAAREESSHIVVEQFVPGADFRILVIGDRVAAAAQREPAQVIGDGSSSIADLVKQVNSDPRRSDGHATSLSWIKLDAVGLGVLAEQGYGPESVPSAGVRVLIRRNGNLSTGGTAADVTDQVHPEVAARAVEAAQVVGLDIAGVDVVALDIGRPLEAQRGAIVEVNAGPGLRMHLEPSSGKPRPVGEAIVASLFPEGRTGRIPIVAVIQEESSSFTASLIAHLLRGAYRLVGMADARGITINGRRIDSGASGSVQRARAILLNPGVEAAVFALSFADVLHEGLGFDACTVAVVAPRQGNRSSISPDQAAVVRTLLQQVSPTGTAVLSADDALAAALDESAAGMTICRTSMAGKPAGAARRSAAERSVFLRDGAVILEEGERQENLVAQGRLAWLPQEQGQLQDLLMGVAAAWSLGLPLPVLRTGLASFAGCAS